MYTWADKCGVVHSITHLNEEHRAARTGCNLYAEPWPKNIIEDVPLTCLVCVTVTDEDIRRAERDDHVGRDIRERGDEVVMRCGAKHREQVDADDRCAHCGYRH